MLAFFGLYMFIVHSLTSTRPFIDLALFRLQASLRYLAEGIPVSAVAPLVGYRTTSAYVAAFRAHTGVTPGRYFQTQVAASPPRRAAGGVPR